VRVRGSHDWKKYQRAFRPPPGARWAVLCYRMDKCTGVSWLDDVSLVELPAEEADRRNLQKELERLQMTRIGHIELVAKPLGWNFQGNSASWTDGQAHTGKRSLRLSQPKFDEKTYWQLWRSDPLPHTGPETLTFSVWVKAANLKPARQGRAASVSLNALDAAGKQLDARALITLPLGTFDWRRFETKLELPRRAGALSVLFNISGLTGDAWLDDIAVVNSKGKNIWPNAGLEQAAGLPHIVMEDLNLPDDFEPSNEKFPPSATEIAISPDGNFVRDGKPVFLLANQEAYQTNPYVYRLLGVDVVGINGICPPSPTLVRRTAWGKMHLSFREDDYVETEIRDILLHGFLAYAEMTEHGKSDPLFTDRPDLFVESGHYFAYHDADPVGRRLRRNLRLSLMQTFRRYPVFMYELFNEVHYTSYHPDNLKRFRRLMREKYGSIEGWKCMGLRPAVSMQGA